MVDKQKASKCRIVRFDWAIKNLLRNKANFDILEGFLSELLKQEIKVKSLLESESNQADAEDKHNRVDILVETVNQEKIVIEVQAATQWDYYHRMLFGTSKIVNEYINKGKSYNSIPRVISVNILFFDLGVGDDYVYVGKTSFHGMHTGNTLEFSESSKKLYLNLDTNISSLEEVFPIYYVIQLEKFKNVIKDRFDQWVYLLKNEQVEPGFDAKGINEALNKLDELKLSPEEQRKYIGYMEKMSHETSIAYSQIDIEIAKEKAGAIGAVHGEKIGLACGEAIGLVRGEARGLERGKLEIAKKMKQSGMENKQIAEITGLDLAEIIMDKQKASECRIVRFDWAIKNLLCNKANFDILEGFLSELLKQEIKVKSLLESESNQTNAEDKYNRVDILVETVNKEKIVIEVQAATQSDYYHRMLFGTSKIVNEYIKKVKRYDSIPRVISINILFFDLGVGDDYVYVGKTSFHGMHTGDTLEFSESSKRLYLSLDTNILSLEKVFPTYYVIQLKKFKNIIKDRFDQWVYLLKNKQIEPGFDAKGIYEALDKLDELKLSPQERKKYLRDMEQMSHEASIAHSHEIDIEVAKKKAEARGEVRGEKIGLARGEEIRLARCEEIGLAHGEARGLERSKLEIAKKMKQSGMEIKQISELTGLDLAEIINL